MERKPQFKKAAALFNRVLSPVDNFLHLESSSGILLLMVTLVAMFFANSGFHEAYEHFIHTPIKLGVGSWSLEMGLQHWVNDALMAIFFFVVGMEIKRELVIGELSSPKRAALPMLAAVGGMIFPALIYYFFNMEGPGRSGWGIPMATDIAFAVGVMSLMSRKVPFALKIFLLALAIVDDLGAVLVIAFFYTSEISAQALGIGFGILALIYVLYASGIRKVPVYVVLGVLCWYFVYNSGIHATIAGVLLGFLMPLKAFYDKRELPSVLTDLVKKIDDEVDAQTENFAEITEAAKDQLHKLHRYTQGSSSALDSTIHTLHPWVSFVIMPMFAFVNAGVRIEGVGMGDIATNGISLGIILGLFIGKPVGVFLTCFAAVKLGIADLPARVNWYKIICTGFLAGIGFTMALFVSNLALSPEQEVFSKVGILIASTIAAVVSLIMLGLSKDDEGAA